ncbi:MAG TPA: hypothetical protein VFR86_31485 [Burkholderiaceae bacterium]|nr:hypothetical protein [Burkholderiaceae bacterium]
MKHPFKSILDKSFIYVPSTATSVDETWRRFGWRPMTEEERKSRQQFFQPVTEPEARAN